MHFPTHGRPQKAVFSVTAAQATYHAPPDSTAGYHPHSSSAYAQAHHTTARKIGHKKAKAHHPRITHPHGSKPHHPKHHILHPHLPPGVEYQPF